MLRIALAKKATPSTWAILIATVLWGDLSNRYVLLLIGVTVAFGVIGFVDDYKKLALKNSKGLSARSKYFWQSVFGLGVALTLYWTHHEPAAHVGAEPRGEFLDLVLHPVGEALEAGTVERGAVAQGGELARRIAADLAGHV